MKTLAMLFVLLMASCATTSPTPANSLLPSELISAKDRHDGSTVLVRGWMKSGFENHALWDSPKSESQGQFMNFCVGLMIPRSMDTDQFNNQYVVVEAIFIKRLPTNIVFLGGCGESVLQLDPSKPPIRISGSG